jgi:urease accessory protein UreF
MASKRERPGASSGGDARAKRRTRTAPRSARSSFSASREWAVYQLLDPLLPTGGFAHSQGLEAAARSGLVAGGDERPSALAADDGWDVEAFATEAMRNAAATAAPFVEAARRAFEGLARRDEEEEEEEEEEEAEEKAEGVEDRRRSKEERDSSRRTHVKLDDDASVDRESASAAASAFSSLDAKMGALLAGNHVASRASAATGAALLRAFLAAHGSGERRAPGPDRNRTSDLENDRAGPGRAGAPPPVPPLGGAPLVAPEATLALRRLKRGDAPRSELAPRRETPRPVREEGSETLNPTPKPVVLRARRPRLHVAVVFGAVVGALGVDAERAARLFAYVVLRDVLSAATRLNLVGPLEAAEALRRRQAAGERLFARALAEARRDAEAAVRAGADPLEGIVRRAACAAPLADIAQGGHDALESRLFSS